MKIKLLLPILLVIFTNSYTSETDLLNQKKVFNQNEEKITLPKIPIYISTSHSSINSNKLFKKVYNSYDSFYELQINHLKTQYKKKHPDKLERNIILSVIGGAVLGFFIDNIIAADKAEELNDSHSTKYFKPTYTIISSILGLPYGYALTKKYESKKKNKPYPYLDIYQLAMYRNKELLDTRIIKTKYNESLDAKDITNFIIKSDINLKRWNSISSLIDVYNKKRNYSTLTSKYIKTMSALENPKGEFETTPQYNDRVRKEQIRKKELQAEMDQKLSIAKEKDEIEKFKLLQEIKNKITSIEFSKSYNFTISNYNADKQCFTFNIADHKKEILIPFAKAPQFKQNSKNYLVQKIYKPTLEGTWETLSDDFILKYSKTDDIIHWEGNLPTFVETAVENPPIISASIKLIDPSGEGYLDAEETSTIQVTLTNTGKGSAKMTRISLFQEKGPTLYYDVSNTIKEILPNKSVTSEFKLLIPENIGNESVNFKISFIEEQGYEPAPLTFTAETREMSKPDLQFVDFGIDDASGDGKLSKGETADITIRIQNIGQGKAKQVAFIIFEDRLENVFIISEKQFELGDFISGESKDITFSISTNKRVSDIIYIDFNIQEERPQFSINEKITLEIEKTQKQLEQIVFSGKDIEKKIEYSDDLSIDIEKNIPQSNKVNENALAVIFGIENYRNVSNVNFAYRDATIMKEYFSSTIGIPKEQIYFRANDEVTLGEFRKIFSKNGWLDKRVIENKTDIYFYYAGHGAPAIKEEKAFLIPFDGDPNYPVQTGYSLETVFENLSKLNANSVTVFLDACFTGANRENEMLLAGARPVSIQLKNNYLNDVTVFSATSSNEISSSYPKNKHGLFSYFLMKGMQGEADTNKDNKLTINELFDYTKKNVSRIAGTLDREQTPQLECLEPEKIIINY